MFHGFKTVAEYEYECQRCGFETERLPFRKGSERFFVLITRPVYKTSTSVESWHLFSEDEVELLDGVINGVNSNYLGKLAENGYFPV